MPSLGADMETGTVIEWRVAPGDVVHRGDIVAVVDTDKSDIEVEVFEDGTVEELLVAVGREVAVGTPLARIRSSDDAVQAISSAGAVSGRVRASPLARQRAAAEGIDLATVVGTGPGGVVQVADLGPPPAASDGPAPETRPDRAATMRRAIGDLMARSKREIPHYHLASTIDLTAAIGWLAAENERRPVGQRLLPAALLLKATARAARSVPTVNGHWDDGFHPVSSIHLGVAVALRGGGLIAPAIHDVDTLPLDELMAALRDVVERARGGRLRSSELSDPTLTVTNLGEQGAEEVLGVIYPPQVALVGFGRIVERPWVAHGVVEVRPTVRATLAADHRASDGHDGSRFLAAVDRLLQAPEDL